MEIVKIRDLSFTYPGTECEALKNISFDINAGEFVVVCGESGCGKTTLLRLMKNELAPNGVTSGEISYKGRNVRDIDDRTSACEIGFVMQDPENQIVTDKVWHELSFGLENIGLRKEAVLRRISEISSFFGINSLFESNTSELSGGQKQLLNLASVMVMQPNLLILDEPTSRLDPIAAAEFIASLKRLNAELGLTVILAEHRLDDVFPIADKTIILEEGRLLFCGTPRQAGEALRASDGHKILAGFPAAVRIFGALGIEDKCPLTVREGREFLTKHCKNRIRTLERVSSPVKSIIAAEMKNVWFCYKKTVPDTLRGINLQVHEGESFSILGGNGAGKTTVLRVLSGQNKAYRGKVLIGGTEIGRYKGRELYRENLALLPQNPQTMFLKQTVAQDCEEIVKSLKLSPGEGAREVEKNARILGIEGLLDRHPYDLSGGEMQKAALLKALLLKPKILLLDEPTKGIDAYFKRTMIEILKDLKKRGLTVILVTHDVEFAAAVSDTCAMLFGGEIVSADTPPDFFGGNYFYTTAAGRLSRHMYQNAVLCEDVIELCRKNGVCK